MAKIINFHDIASPQWFEDTLDVIQELYEVVPFSEVQRFYQGKSKSKNIAHLTVDDGHFSTYTIIYPALKKRDLSASIFVSPKIITEQSNFWYEESGDYEADQLKTCISEVLNVSVDRLKDFYPRSVMKTLTLEQNWEIIRLYQKKFSIPTKKYQYINTSQLLEMEASGVFDIGAHTQNHPILANETDVISRYEIQESVKNLGELLGRKITTFAYPNGSYDLDFGSREMEYLKEVGIDYAFSFQFKDLNIKDHLLSIPRYGLYHGTKDFVRKKLKYGNIWEPLKAKLFNNEDKHRKLIMKKLQNHA
ncbi:polysaccharide deacetylase family protein [Elizabethkingia sp. JS20170427COW]|uniref:polysaccharide deacetylase family protein n=1 Tax=Elizabethkingia sp. JS20170427COW TaxID=2583851 RepID=UPI001110B52E|nr:polysaccharide deacetylase family protein [Elizabethkingia sp. JS20170427COW]QCX53424.1 polysaccharide deacetylase family protein [Elizabethkingia sp. JS20170427COW]